MCRQDFGPNLKSAGFENLLETKPGTNINTAPDGSVIIYKPVEKQSMSDCKVAGVPASFGQLVIRCGKGVARLGDTVSWPLHPSETLSTVAAKPTSPTAGRQPVTAIKPRAAPR